MTVISFDMVECTSEAPQAYREQFRDPGRVAYRHAQSRIIKGNLQEPADTLDIRGRSNYVFIRHREALTTFVRSSKKSLSRARI